MDQRSVVARVMSMFCIAKHCISTLNARRTVRTGDNTMKQYLYRWGMFNIIAHARNRKDADAVVFGYHGVYAKYARKVKDGERFDQVISVAYQYS
jgi:hypothetical protein